MAEPIDFQISPIEMLALRKLYLVSKALATKLPHSSAREQDCLADTLREVLDRYELARVMRAGRR